MKIVINSCYGGFSLSQLAYEKLIEWGVPVQKYIKEKKSANDGEVIFDRSLDENPDDWSNLVGRYWETWLSDNRAHKLLVRVVEELGKAADGPCAKLKIVEVPIDVKWKIDEYDGFEHVAEVHRTWQ
jgi:hypothetical protein